MERIDRQDVLIEELKSRHSSVSDDVSKGKQNKSFPRPLHLVGTNSTFIKCKIK